MYDYHHVCITHGGTEARSSVHDVAVGLIEAACASLARASTFQIQHSTFKIPVCSQLPSQHHENCAVNTRAHSRNARHALTAETFARGRNARSQRKPPATGVEPPSNFVREVGVLALEEREDVGEELQRTTAEKRR